MSHPSCFAEADPELDAYNAAFDELGLDWHWNRTTLRSLAAIPIEEARVAEYLRVHHSHLLSVYPVDFLANAIVSTKTRIRARDTGVAAPV